MLQNSTHAFIVRIWFEPRETPHLAAEWRGMVQYVASGKQRYFNNFEQLVAFIADETGLPDHNDSDFREL